MTDRPRDPWSELLPWQRGYDQPESGKAATVWDESPKPLLYGPKGEPLTKRNRVGFQPPARKP